MTFVIVLNNGKSLDLFTFKNKKIRNEYWDSLKDHKDIAKAERVGKNTLAIEGCVTCSGHCICHDLMNKRINSETKVTKKN